MLTCMVTLEKRVCEQRATRRWALERAIVIFSGHVRSSVGRSEDRGGQRDGGTRRRFAAGGRMWSHGRLYLGTVAQPTGAKGRGTPDLVAPRERAALLVSGPNDGSCKMTRSGAGRIETSIKGEAVRCEGGLAGQRKTAAP
jgi:hypothetical protein